MTVRLDKSAAVAAYRHLAQFGGAPAQVPVAKKELLTALGQIKDSTFAPQLELIRSFLEESGFAAFRKAVSKYGSQYGVSVALAGDAARVRDISGKAAKAAGAMGVDHRALHARFAAQPDLEGKVRVLTRGDRLPDLPPFPETRAALLDELRGVSEGEPLGAADIAARLRYAGIVASHYVTRAMRINTGASAAGESRKLMAALFGLEAPWMIIDAPRATLPHLDLEKDFGDFIATIETRVGAAALKALASGHDWSATERAALERYVQADKSAHEPLPQLAQAAPESAASLTELEERVTAATNQGDSHVVVLEVLGYVARQLGADAAQVRNAALDVVASEKNLTPPWIFVDGAELARHPLDGALRLRGQVGAFLISPELTLYVRDRVIADDFNRTIPQHGAGRRVRLYWESLLGGTM